MDANTIWDEYNRGVEYLTRYNYYYKATESYRFFNGDQWAGAKTGGERLPQLNFIQPIVKYKVGTVNSNGNTIYYSCNDTDGMYIAGSEVCKKINSLALKTWERLKMDTLMWTYSKHAAIVGDAYAYFFYGDNGITPREIKNTDILFADEQETDIQRQKYILIVQRLMASEVKEEARANGVSEDDIALIMPDTNTEHQIGDKAQTEIEQDEDGKLTCVTKFFKKNGTVHMVKCTQNIIYYPDTEIAGLTLYPIAHQSWDHEVGSARGIGEVYNIIPNQMEVNKNFARHLIMSKNYVYPHIVYDSAKINPAEIAKLTTVGSSIGIANAPTQELRNVIDYMRPPGVPNDCLNVVNQLISLTRELSGSSDIATGQINPEQASGTAILAVRDAAALPLNEQSAHQKQFIEDIARIWLNLWIAYNPNGLVVAEETEDEYGNKTYSAHTVDTAALQELNLDVKVDVSPANPFSKYAQEQTLQNFFMNKILTFEEYVEALDDDAAAPKSKLKAIIEKQKQAAMEQQEEQAQMEAAQQMEAEQAKTDETAATLERLVSENAMLKETTK